VLEEQREGLANGMRLDLVDEEPLVLRVVAERHGAARPLPLAAEVELATPECERWIVQTESFYDARCRVYIELADATPAEAERRVTR